jgi:hypothetical protein
MGHLYIGFVDEFEIAFSLLTFVPLGFVLIILIGFSYTP